jgi:3',5'-cyclic AMP phosphodiesterase CpdA
MSREWPLPASENTLWIPGDVHFAHVDTSARPGFSKVLQDLASATVPDVLAIVQCGDIVNLAADAEDDQATAWLESAAAALGGAPYYTIMGNHDVYGVGGGGSGRSAAAWCAHWGYASQRYTVDFGDFFGIMFAPDGELNTLTQANLDWLDDTLADAGKPCLIFCHWPLYDTVVGDTGVYWSSTETSFFLRGPNGSTDAEIRAVLNARSQAKAWICGHTHSPLAQPGFVLAENVGSRTIAHINTSALYYQGRTLQWNDPWQSEFLTVYEDRLELRFRDHGAGAWASLPGDDRVWSYTL